MKKLFVRNGMLALALVSLLSCGGGGGGNGAGSLVGLSGVASSTASTGSGSPASIRDGAAVDAGGDSTSAGGATSSGGSTSTAGSTTTASGDDGSGVGSGGTGVSTADAVGIGSVDGLGSIIVNGLRYNTDAATVRVDDAPSLQIGMTVKVTGPIDADHTSGVAKLVESAAELRGPSSSINTVAGTFVVQGTTVTTDESTVWADSSGLAGIASGTTLQVWGLPASPGVLRATRVEQRATSSPIVTGTVQGLNTGLRTFTLGGLSIDYGAALLAGSVDASALANGVIVRVRASGLSAPGVLAATLVQAWNPLPHANGLPVQLAGVITDYATLGSFRVLGTTVDASQAKITGGPAGSIGNGVKVEVDGIYANGVLGAAKLKIKHVPGTGGPSSFNVIGAVGNFVSPASFRVRGQPVNASGAGVVFVNGSASNLSNGTKVNVSGSQIVNGVLIADRVSFE